MNAAWYFDTISPYAYLHFKLHDRITWPGGVVPQIDYVPVLFAGLLKTNGTKGPAEIAEKRRVRPQRRSSGKTATGGQHRTRSCARRLWCANVRHRR